MNCLNYTKYDADKSDLWQGDVAYEPIEKVLRQTGLTYQDRAKNGLGIDRILTAGEDHFVWKTSNPFWIHHYLGAYGISLDNVSADCQSAWQRGVQAGFGVA